MKIRKFVLWLVLLPLLIFSCISCAAQRQLLLSLSPEQVRELVPLDYWTKPDVAVVGRLTKIRVVPGHSNRLGSGLATRYDMTVYVQARPWVSPRGRRYLDVRLGHHLTVLTFEKPEISKTGTAVVAFGYVDVVRGTASYGQVFGQLSLYQPTSSLAPSEKRDSPPNR